MIGLRRERLILENNGKNNKWAMDDRWDDLYDTIIKSSRRDAFIYWMGNEEYSRISRIKRDPRMLLPCIPNRCDKLKDRLTSHKLACHHSQSKVTIEFPPPSKDVSYVESKLQIPKIETRFKGISLQSCGQGASTVKSINNKSYHELVDISLRNQNQVPKIETRPKSISIQSSGQGANTVKAMKNKSHHKLVDIPLRNQRAHELVPRTNFYKQHLEDEIIKWFLIIPTATQNPKRDFLRFKVIINLIEKLTDLSNYVDSKDYHNEIIHEIEYCVDVLLMWSTRDKLQRQYLKNHLTRLLLNSVEALNEKWLRHPDKSWNTVANCDLQVYPSNDVNNIEILRDEIAKWIDEKLIIASALESSKHKEFLTDVFANRLIPIVKTAKNKKKKVKAEIRNIFEEFSPMIKMPKSRTTFKVQLNTLATDLTDKLRDAEGTSSTNNEYYDSNNSIHKCKTIEDHFSMELVNILKLTDAPEDTINDLTEVFSESVELVGEEKDRTEVDSVHILLQKSGELSEVEALSLANTLIDNVKARVIKDFGKTFKSHSSLVLLTSEQELVNPFRNQPLTSTPLLQEQEKDFEKLNAEERLYLDKVAKVVEAWLDTTEKPFETNEDQFFKQTIAKDIAGEIKDFVKMSQMQESIKKSIYEYTIHYIIMKASQKYNLFDDPANAPQVDELKQQILDLEIPKLLMPQHGNRQDIANIMAQIMNPEHDPRPDALNILEDNISVWMNEQPSEIFKDQDRSERNNQLHDVAIKVQKDLEQKKSEGEIKTELAHWLNNIVHPNAKIDVDQLAEELKDKVIKLPQNETIDLIAQKRARARAGEDTDLDVEKRESKAVNNLPQNEPISKTAQNSRTTTDDDANPNSKQEQKDKVTEDPSDADTNPDKQLKQILEKYVEYNYEVKDPIVERALGNILMQEFEKLSPIIGKEASEDEEINTKHFRKELEYIAEITDWLRNLSFYPLLNSVTDRVEFINDLARIIADLEQERVAGPADPEYELLLYDNILHYVNQLPLPPQYMPQVMVSANQLRRRIAKHRPSPGSLSPSNDKAIQSEHDVVKLMEEFISKLYGEDIGDDQLLREAYIARLFKEIRKMMNAGIFSNTQFIEQLEAVPFPRRESVKRFDTEMRYAAEIADWLHNFPLIPLKSVEDYETRIRKISVLAEKMVQADERKAANDPDVDKYIDFEITNWIHDLDLQPEKEIVVPLLISQLKRRMEEVHKLDEKRRSTLPVFFQDGSANRTRGQEEDYANVGSGKSMVKAIDNWCLDLPINEENKDLREATKENIAINILKKVGELSDDPHVANNDPLFEELLADHIDDTLMNLSQKYPDIGDKKKELQVSIVKEVMDAKKGIKRKSTGGNYEYGLKFSIESSFPNPVDQPPSQDPAFEIYKHRIAMLWLLENYDNASNHGAMKYRMKLNQDIENYADQAQKRNTPYIEKSVLFKEFYGSLNKQSTPSEQTIKEEVEKVKIRCEVDEWFKELPLKEPSGFNDLLERDQIMEILAKKLFDIERNKDPDHADERMRKEILKCIKKLPILPGEDGNLKMYADKLICMLKATADQRACNRGVNKPSKRRNSQIIEINKVMQLEVPHRKENTSQIPGPSGVNPPHREKPAPPRRKAEDFIAATVHNWCRQLPLKTDSPGEEQYIKNEASDKVNQLVIDLVTNPTILNNKDLFEHHLNVGIQKILSDLHGYSEKQSAKNARKAQLVSELGALRHLVKDDLDREGYKQNLKSIGSSFMEETAKPNRIRIENSAQNQIVDDVVQYNNENSDVDPKLTSVRLITEIAKVRPPRQSPLSDDVIEMRMKKDVSDLIKVIPDSAEKEQTESTLTRNLVNIQREGGEKGDDKMKAVIDKAVGKYAVDISPQEIDAFISRINSKGAHRPPKVPYPQRPFQPQITPQFRATPPPSPPTPRPFTNPVSPKTVQNIPINEPNMGPTHNQGPSNVLSIPVDGNSGTRITATAQISAQTENEERNWRVVKNNARHAGTETGQQSSDEGLMRMRQPLYCDECEAAYDCEYDIPWCCPCDIFQGYCHF